MSKFSAEVIYKERIVATKLGLDVSPEDQMKIAEVAAAVFGFAHPLIISIGERSMPPPIPTRPQVKPIIPRINNALETLRVLFSATFIFLPINNFQAA